MTEESRRVLLDRIEKLEEQLTARRSKARALQDEASSTSMALKGVAAAAAAAAVMGASRHAQAVCAATSKDNWYKDRAALLDPAAYTYYSGSGSMFTVPAGETWYAVNLWHIEVGSSNYFFQRLANANAPLVLPAGTTVSGVLASAFAYVCRPSLVFSDARYSCPEQLYYDRLQNLTTYTLNSLYSKMTSGSAPGTKAGTLFPNDFHKALIVSASVQDCAWLALDDGGTTIINLQNEVSDDHQVRYAQALFLPFTRSTFNHITVCASSKSGNGVSTSLEGHGSIKYFKLPSGW